MVDLVADVRPAPPPPSERGGKIVFSLLGLLLALAGAYTAVWFWAAGLLRDGIQSWAEARRAEGVAVTYSGPGEVTGFPLFLHARLEAPSLAAPDWRWSGDALEIEGRPWAWDRLTLRAPGHHAATLPWRGRPLVLDGQTEGLEAEIRLLAGRAETIDATARRLVLAAADPGLDMAADRLRLVLRRGDGTKESGSLHLEADGLDLPDGSLDLPLGRHLESLAADGSITGPLPAALAYEPLLAWRNEGGTIEIPNLSLSYGPLSLSGNGTLALDSHMQPTAAFGTKAQGFFEVVDLLEKRGLIRRNDADTARMVLGVLARTPPGGGKPVLDLPLTVQARRLFAGPVPLVKLEAVVWPGTPPEAVGAPGPAPVQEEKL